MEFFYTGWFQPERKIFTLVAVVLGCPKKTKVLKVCAPPGFWDHITEKTSPKKFQPNRMTFRGGTTPFFNSAYPKI